MEVRPASLSHEMLTPPMRERREKSAPGPRGRRLLGSLLEVRRDRLKFVMQATREYGDLICFRMGPKRLYLLNHPDYARHVLCDNVSNYSKGLGLAEAEPLLGKGLLTSGGDLWASQRRLLQAAFHGKQMEQFSGAMVSTTRATLEHWQFHEGAEHQVDIAEEMVRLAINILGRTLFRSDFSQLAGPLSRDLNVLTGWAMARMTSLLGLPMSMPTPRHWRARNALWRLDLMVSKMFRLHEQANGDGNDLLSLLAAQGAKNGDRLAHEKQKRDEVMTLLLAGHETTAATLAWTWYLLARHPEVERRLHSELDEVLAGRAPTLADVPRLVYTKMIVDEVLRLYPPVWLLPRKAIANDRLGGYVIPAKSDVLVCLYTLHRHPDFWDDAEDFNPQRFAPEHDTPRRSSAYLPFGAGPRTCLGSRFGLMEVMLVVAAIAQRYSLKLSAEQRVEADASLTLHPRGGLAMTLHRRN